MLSEIRRHFRSTGRYRVPARRSGPRQRPGVELPAGAVLGRIRKAESDFVATGPNRLAEQSEGTRSWTQGLEP